MSKRILASILLASLTVPTAASAHTVPQTKFLETAKPYGPYEFLIGDWYTNLPQENAVIHQQFGWGPGKASMTYATYVDMAGKPEHLHFGGTMVWNPATKALDFLFAVEPGSGVQEKGAFEVQPDGSVVREVEATYPGGKVIRSRQLFRAGPNQTVSTDLLSKTAKGWASTLPGGPMVMTKTPPEQRASQN